MYRRRASASAKALAASAEQFTECQWRDMDMQNPFNRDELPLAIDAVAERLRHRLHIMLYRWLLPATAYTDGLFFRFVVESLVTEDLVVDDAPFQCVVSHEIFTIVDEYSAVRNVFEIKLNSPEYVERFTLYKSLVSQAIVRFREFLAEAAAAFVSRAIDDATAPEAGLASGLGNMYLVSLLYGMFEQTGPPSIRTWQRLHTSDHEFTEDTPVATGILRLIMMQVREYRESVMTMPNAAATVGIGAARLLTDQLAQRFTDPTIHSLYVPGARDVKGIVMRKTDELAALISDVFHCPREFARDAIMFNPSYAPNSPSQLVNVPFLVENILFAVQRGTLTIPRMSHNYDRMLAKHWVRTRSRLRNALCIAFASPRGVSLRKLQEFAYDCNTTSRVFLHMNRCLNLVMHGLMAHYKFAREEASALQSKMLCLMEAEMTVETRTEFPEDSPWSGVVTYDGAETYINMSVLVERMAELTVRGTVTKTVWVSRPVFTPAKRLVDSTRDPGHAGMWRVLNTAFAMRTVGKDAQTYARTVFETTNAAPEMIDIGFSRTLPTFMDVVYNICHGRGSKDVTTGMLPTFVLLWNAAMVIRKRLRESSDGVTIPKSRQRKRTRESFLCVTCMDERPSRAVAMGCEHSMCDVCAAAMVESRVMDAFIGKGGHSGPTGACPIPHCTGCMSDDTLHELMAPEVLAAHVAVLTSNEKSARHGVACSFCGECAPDGYNPAVDGAVFTCNVCATNTCSQCEMHHHPGVACVKRVAGKPTPQDLLSEAKIQCCPVCKIPEVKRRNCNHLVCKACKTDWCWACATVLPSGDTTSHYRDESPSCVMYSVQTETERMKRRILAMKDQDADTVRAALHMLEDSLHQTDDDI